MAADEIHEALMEGDLSAARFANYAQSLRGGIENMRKLVYAFYEPDFSFRELTEKYPDAHGPVTDCLSGDVNKDFTKLWSQIQEFVSVPDALPVGAPLIEAEAIGT
jgi:hypothetical protein